MSKQIAVVGLGMGFAWAALLSSQGYEVTGLDIDQEKIENFRKDKSVRELFKKEEEKVRENLNLTTNYDEISESDLVFIVVSTVYDKNKKQLDIEPVISALKSADRYTNAEICIMTTLPYGANETLSSVSDYCYVPEMVAQGNYIGGFKNPPFLVLGATDKEVGKEVKTFYQNFFDRLDETMPPLYMVSPEIAEITKLIANAFLMTKITFANTIGGIGEALSIDANLVLEIIGNDSRIGSEFLNAGYSFGGHCFPHDLSSLISTFEEFEVPSDLFETVEKFNQKRTLAPIRVLQEKQFLEESKSIAVLGLTYKDGISDTRGSPSLELVTYLKESEHDVETYDPNLSEGEGLIDLLSKSEIIIVTNSEPQFKNIGSLISEDCEAICDFSGIVDKSFLPSKVKLFKVGEGWIN